MNLKLVVPAGVLLIGALSATTGCGTEPAAAPAGDQRPAPVATTDAPGGKKYEEPLTGKLKERAEKAALAKYPGTVKKSEHDVERPGHYAVEIELDAGGEVEVYLDKQFNVVGTKDEAGAKDDD